MLRAARLFVLPITLRSMFCNNLVRTFCSFVPRTSYLVFFTFLILHSEFMVSQNACNCDEGKLAFTQSYISSHQLIFRGKTLSTAKGEDYAMATFSVTQLFKGSCPKEVTVYFDKRSECGLKMNRGEDWIVYANFKQLQKPYVEYCSRSRKNVINTNKNVEVQYIKSDLSVDVESEKLQGQLGVQKLAAQSEQDNRHRNVIPGFTQRIILILVSIAGFVLIYLGVTKFLKK